MLGPAEPGHNRSSSPSTTLDDRAERKVPKHRSRANPTFDQRHDSELMHIMLLVRGATLVKVFGLYCRVMGYDEARGELRCTRVYGKYARGFSTL